MKYTTLALLAFTSLSPLMAHADMIVGSESVGFDFVTVSPSGSPLNPISGVTKISFQDAETTSAGGGDLSGITGKIILGGSLSFNPNAVDGFNLIFGNYGTFTETSIQTITNTTTSGSSNFEVYILGTFAPGSADSQYSSNNASLDIAFTDTGNVQYSGSGNSCYPPGWSRRNP